MLYKYFRISEPELQIECKLYYSDLKSIRKVVFSCHGFGGHRDNGATEKFAVKLLDKFDDIAVITFNLPGHGNDANILSLENCSKYISAVINYIKSNLHVDKPYAYATSFGGYLMLKYAAENENTFKKLAFRCPAVNMYDVLTGRIMSEEELRKINDGKCVPVGFDRKVIVSPKFIDELRRAKLSDYDFSCMSSNILILHGTEDEIVPFSSGEEFCESNSIGFIPVEGADHRFQNPDHMDNAIERIMAFLFDVEG